MDNIILVRERSEYAQSAAVTIAGAADGFDILVKSTKYSAYIDKIIVDERPNGLVNVCWLDSKGREVSSVFDSPSRLPATLSDSRVVKAHWVRIPLEYYRKRAGLTQQQLADKAGVHLNQINRVERAERSFNNMSVATAIKIAKALNVSVEELCDSDVNI